HARCVSRPELHQATPSPQHLTAGLVELHTPRQCHETVETPAASTHNLAHHNAPHTHPHAQKPMEYFYGTQSHHLQQPCPGVWVFASNVALIPLFDDLCP